MGTRIFSARCDASRNRQSANRLRALFAVPIIGLVFATCLTGCGNFGNKGLVNARKVVKSGNEVLELFRSVKDAESARAAIGDLDTAYQELIAAQKAIIEHEKEHGMTRGRKTEIDKLQADIAKMQVEMEQEGERLTRLKGLPAEFWEPLRRHTYTIAGMTVQYMIDQGAMPDPELGQEMLAICALYREVPIKDIVEATFRINRGERDAAIQKLREKLPAGTRIHAVDDGGNQIVVIGPTSMEQLVQAADFARVVDRYDEAGEVTLDWLSPFARNRSGGEQGAPAAANGDLHAEFEEAIAEAEHATPEPEVPATLTEPPVDFDSSHRDAVAQHGAGGVMRYELVNYPELEAAGMTMPAHQLMQAFAQQPADNRSIYQYGWVAPVENYPAICDYVATFAEIVDRNNEQQTLKLKLTAEKLPPLDDEQLLKVVGRWLPNESDPDYYKHLSELMWNAEKLGVNDAAVDKLLFVDDVAQIDQEVRKQVARNFRSVAMQDTVADGRAVEGLVLYAGKYSVPVLIELLDRPASRIHNEVIAALGRLRDPRGAVKLAECLKNDSERDAAMQALEEMGPVAEVPLIKAAESDDTLVVQQVIQMLGQMGTKKSYPILRRLSRQRDEEISSAAKNALTTIIYREKAKKAG
jgi:hypothetical protein